jgi:Apea-like HEPN
MSQNNKADTSISTKKMLYDLKYEITNRLIDNLTKITLPVVEKAFASAFKEAAKSRTDSRHFIPCRLTLNADPDSFTIGPVKFHSAKSFRQIGEPLVSKVIEHRKGNKSSFMKKGIFNYYANFSSVADVTIINCDEEIGQERATLAVNAALDFLHLRIGHHHSRKMVVGGPGLSEDNRGYIKVVGGQTKLTYSMGSTLAVGFESRWAESLDTMGWDTWMVSAGKAIETITNPSIIRPLGLRFVDAASWHGQGIREISPAAAIVKSVTALERLVITEKSTTEIVSERCAAIRHHPTEGPALDILIAELKDIYDLRSRLVHGSLSPFDPEVRSRKNQVLEVVEKTLVAGLDFFDVNGGLDRPLTPKQLKVELENRLTLARNADARR